MRGTARTSMPMSRGHGPLQPSQPVGFLQELCDRTKASSYCQEASRFQAGNRKALEYQEDLQSNGCVP